MVRCTLLDDLQVSCYILTCSQKLLNEALTHQKLVAWQAALSLALPKHTLAITRLSVQAIPEHPINYSARLDPLLNQITHHRGDYSKSLFCNVRPRTFSGERQSAVFGIRK